MQCRTIAIFLAIATFAFLRPMRLTRRRPQACSGDHRLVRWMSTLAASNRYDPSGDASRQVKLSGLFAPRRQAQIGADTGSRPEARGIVDGMAEREGRDDTDTRYRHQSTGRLIRPGQSSHARIECCLLLADAFMNGE